MGSALAVLVDDPEAFREKWPNEPRVFKSSQTMGVLFDRDDARRILAEPGVRPFQAGMVKDGALTGARLSADHPTDTLGLNGLHLTWGPLVEFCKALTAELGHQVTGNAYLTPPNSKGYPPHWDTHHVWLAQVEGSKHWRLNRPVFAEPLERHNWKAVGFSPEQLAAVTTGEPDFACELKAGEVLWIPKGWVHHGHTEEARSTHITFGVQLLTRHWILERLVDAAAADPAFRVGLPPDLSQADFGRLGETVAASLSDWFAGAKWATIGHDVWLAQQAAMLGRK